jgi:hypothetical protein
MPAVNYGRLIFGALDRGRLTVALAELLSLPVESVDVGDEGDDDRRWEAPVSCTVTPLAGDLHWHLDIYLGNTLPTPPPEAVAAAWVSARLRTVVGYQAAPSPPSAYWLVGPDGRRTRARIYEEESALAPVYRIDAVEHPLAVLPGLPVAALPEVIRSYRMRTAVTDRLREQWQPWLAAYEKAAAGPTRPDPAAKAVRDAVTRLGAWEGMVTRLVEGWPPDGWYPADYYREDLAIRDELSAAADSLPEPASDELRQALAEVDHLFVEATEDDGGRALAAETGSLPIGSWWWFRVPRPLPMAGCSRPPGFRWRGKHRFQARITKICSRGPVQVR